MSTRPEDPPLHRLLTILGEGALTILITVLVVLLSAGAYLLSAPKVYTAEADLLVTPVPREDSLLAGLGLVRESADPTREVQTIARLATTPDVAERARRKLGTPGSSLLDKITAEPVADSNLVTLSAEGSSPHAARDLANAFALSAVEVRSERLRRSARRLISGLRRQARTLPKEATSGPESVVAQIGRLEVLRAGGDPTIRVEALARAPSEPTHPQPARTLGAAILAGVVLGLGGVFLLQAVRPRSPTSEPFTTASGASPRGSSPLHGQAAAQEKAAPALDP